MHVRSAAPPTSSDMFVCSDSLFIFHLILWVCQVYALERKIGSPNCNIHGVKLVGVKNRVLLPRI